MSSLNRKHQYSIFLRHRNTCFLNFVKIIFIRKDCPSHKWRVGSVCVCVLVYVWAYALACAVSEVKKCGAEPRCPWSCSTSSSRTLHGREPIDLMMASYRIEVQINRSCQSAQILTKLYYPLPTELDSRAETGECVCVLGCLELTISGSFVL